LEEIGDSGGVFEDKIIAAILELLLVEQLETEDSRLHANMCAEAIAVNSVWQRLKKFTDDCADMHTSIVPEIKRNSKTQIQIKFLD
jgi:hypothetical protein